MGASAVPTRGPFDTEVRMSRALLLAFAFAVTGAWAQTQVPARFEGTLVSMSGSAEMQVANDEAVANLFVEVQDGDAARAQSQVNQGASSGVAAIRHVDPKAVVETSGYLSYPVYEPKTAQRLIGWRVRQSVTMRTTELATLSKTVVAAQRYLALGGIDFRLSRAAREHVEGDLIQGAIANLNSRIAAAAAALGVPRERQRIEELNFGAASIGRPPVPMARLTAASADAIVEPQLDAGQSMQQMTVSAKVRFLP
jgi:predicted secreted protein